MKILVGISGGVDSAAAALRLASEGHLVECAILKMHEFTDLNGARSVASSLGLPLHEIDMTDSFDCIVKENLVNEYMLGRTPNPCILCNEQVKFRGLYDHAVANGFDKIATGHYAHVRCIDGRYSIADAADSKKNQSYMLYRLPQDVLSALLLPLADEKKENVRSMTRAAGLSVAENPDSQEICFLPDGDYPGFIESRRGLAAEGDFIDGGGKVLGRHKGIIRYTVGQRKGLGISLGARAFVTDISPENNTVTLSDAVRGVTEVEITNVVYSGMAESSDFTVLDMAVKLRYSAAKIPVVAEHKKDKTVVLKFDTPVTAAPGQSAVIYDGDRVLFGGFINK